jgi:hypothetical protein
MSLTIKIGPAAHKKVLSINARRTLEGNIMIYDHPEIDVIIDPRAKKITLFPKNKMSDDVYDVQNRLFEELAKKGIVPAESVQGGNVYGALEAYYPESEAINALNMVLISLDNFISEDKTFYVYNDVFQRMEQEMLYPDEESSTELGEVPHDDQKGTMRPGYIYPYGSYGALSLYRI